MVTDHDAAFHQALRAEYTRLSARQRELQAQLQALEAELETVADRLEHIRALLPDWSAAEIRGEDRSSKKDDAIVNGDPVELARTILEERGGEPMHYRELAARVQQRGGSLPGSDPALTLVSRLVRDDRFVRPLRRGWYALRIHYPKAKNIGARRSTRRGGRGARDG